MAVSDTCAILALIALFGFAPLVVVRAYVGYRR